MIVFWATKYRFKSRKELYFASWAAVIGCIRFQSESRNYVRLSFKEKTKLIKINLDELKKERKKTAVWCRVSFRSKTEKKKKSGDSSDYHHSAWFHNRPFIRCRARARDLVSWFFKRFFFVIIYVTHNSFWRVFPSLNSIDSKMDCIYEHLSIDKLSFTFAFVVDKKQFARSNMYTLRSFRWCNWIVKSIFCIFFRHSFSSSSHYYRVASPSSIYCRDILSYQS